MKKPIIANNYKLYNKKIKNKDINIILISDIHYSSTVSIKRLNEIKDKIDKLNPDYICIAGDIIDSLNFISDKVRMNSFYNWIHKLGYINNKYIPVLISIGNHDTLYVEKNHKRKQIHNSSLYQEFVSNIKSPNIYILDNNIYTDNYVNIVGFTHPKELYHSNKLTNLDKEYYSNINKKLLNPSTNKLNIALIHSPIKLEKPYISDKLKKFDLILSGHMHNGLMPPIIEKILKGNYGIIYPNKQLFPKIARGLIKINNNTNLIISGGITKLQWTSGILHYGNIMFPMHIENIKIKKPNCKL